MILLMQAARRREKPFCSSSQEDYRNVKLFVGGDFVKEMQKAKITIGKFTNRGFFVVFLQRFQMWRQHIKYGWDY